MLSHLQFMAQVDHKQNWLLSLIGVRWWATVVINQVKPIYFKYMGSVLLYRVYINQTFFS